MPEAKMGTRKKRPAVKKPTTKPEKITKKSSRLGSKKSSTADSTTQPENTETVAGNGIILLSKGALLGRIAAWTFVAFLAVGAVLAVIQASTPAVEAKQIDTANDGSEKQQAGDYAKGFVASWLRATRDDTSALAAYMNVSSGEISATKPVDFRDIAVASSEIDSNGIATVIVSADVLTTIEEQGLVTGDVKKTSAYVPAWFQVNIQNRNDTLSVLSWPAPIPTPKTETPSILRYSNDASADVRKTVESFFRAYVLDEGEVARIIHPESTIQALGPNPYTAVKVLGISTDKNFEDGIPSDGTSARALIDLSLGAGEEAFRTATYSMTLESRGGRWEVRAIDPAPLVTPASNNLSTGEPTQ